MLSFFRQTIATPLGAPDLVPPLSTYHKYFDRDKTNPFANGYASVLSPYVINSTNPGAAMELRAIARQIYSTPNEGDDTAFLLWNSTPCVDTAVDLVGSSYSIRFPSTYPA